MTRLFKLYIFNYRYNKFSDIINYHFKPRSTVHIYGCIGGAAFEIKDFLMNGQQVE